VRASLIIATYNDGDLLIRTIGSVVENTAGLEYELLIADNASTDGSVNEARALFPLLRHIPNLASRGPSPTKHLAACQATGDVLVFLDGHGDAAPGAIERLVADVEELDGRALVLPRIAHLDPRAQVHAPGQVGQCQRMSLETLDQGEYARVRGFRQQGRYYESAALIGCGFAVARATYHALLGFDTDMRVWGSEDVDLGLKAWLMGYSVLHAPVPLLGHRFASIDSGYAVPPADVLANKLRMARKHFTTPVWDEWLQRAKARHGQAPFDEAFTIFESRRESAEREREFFMAHRVHDESWFTERFGLDWPKRS